MFGTYKFYDHPTKMKYFFQAILLGFFVAALANSNLTSKLGEKGIETKKPSQCNVNNNNYNSFYAGPSSKKIENMIYEVKQQLAEMKEELGEMKGNQTGGPGEKASNSATSASQCNVTNYNSFIANHTKKMEHMFSEVKQQLVELKEEIKDMKENHTCGPYAKVYKNCAEVYKSGDKISGVYKIDPDGLGEFEVFCDQKTASGGWTVFQKRFNGSVDFFRALDDYKRGFGNLNGEFWLGLDKVYRLTVSSSNKLRVDLEDVRGNKAFAEYSSFSLASERVKYQLSLGSYSGTAGDSLSYHRGRPFSAKDRDNDSWRSNCASSYKGGWWYGSCYNSNLNGLYLNGKSSYEAMAWMKWRVYQSVKRSEMKIRPKDF